MWASWLWFTIVESRFYILSFKFGIIPSAVSTSVCCQHIPSSTAMLSWASIAMYMGSTGFRFGGGVAVALPVAVVAVEVVVVELCSSSTPPQWQQQQQQQP